MSEIDLTRHITVNNDGTVMFRATRHCEVADASGGTSLIVDRAWIAVATTWGGSTFKVTFLDRSGRVLGGNTPDGSAKRYENNAGDSYEAPKGAFTVTVEGVADKGAIPTAELVQHAK